jgi:hypothetical protein
MTDQPIKDKKTRTRSPAYPFINLETAIRRAREFWEKEQRNAANLKVAVDHWGYDQKSSGGLQTAAAMVSFGLLKDEGSGPKRKLQLTSAALRIILDPTAESKERSDAIKQAALAPKIHQRMWQKWGSTLPSDASLKYTLLTEWEPPFNPNSVDGFIKQYKDTIAFAKLSESDTLTQEVENNGDLEGEHIPYVAKVGDYVQWEHNGTLGFPEPKRVKGISPDGNWAYVDGQHGAVPMSELLRESDPPNPQNPAEPNLAQRFQSPPKKHMQEFVVPLSDGSKAVFQWPSVMSSEDIADLKDSLKIVERKISRAAATESSKDKTDES